MPGPESTAKRAELVARLRQGIEEVKHSKRFIEYLRFAAAFHNYSFNNRLLIWCQRPDAAQVAGFRAWLKLGRYVRKGEKGIAILAPMPWKRTDEESDEIATGVNFKVVHVFDVSQTEGEDLPALAATLAGDADELVAGLYAVASGEGLSISREAESIGAMGYYVRSRKAIWLSPEIDSSAQLAQTLAHELGHHFADEDCTRAVGELIADSAAYLVLGHFGIDAGVFSFDYVAAWASRAEDDAWEKALAKIHQVADAIISAAA